MRYIKMLGLAAVAAIAAMAFVGASSASATVVCSLTQFAKGQGACPAGEFEYEGAVIGVNAEKEGKPIKDTFKSGFVTVECTGEMNGTVETNGTGKIETVKWEPCTNSIGCKTTTAAAESTPWVAEVFSTGAMTVKAVQGSFTLTGGTCLTTQKCIYKAAEVHPTFINHSGAATSAQIVAKELELERVTGSSSSCSATGKWSATYNVHGKEGALLSVH